MPFQVFRPAARRRGGRVRLAPRARRHLAGLTAASSMLLAAAVTPAGGGLLTAGAAAANENVDMMSGRSPGERSRADMLKGKPVAAPARVARALPRTRNARPAAAAVAPPAPVAAAPLLAPPGAASAPAAIVPGGPGGAFFGPAAPGGIFGFFPPPPGFGGGGGGGGGVIITPSDETNPVPPDIVPTPPVAAPIPEPAMWVTMIAGFGMVGGMVRKRHPRRGALNA